MDVRQMRVILVSKKFSVSFPSLQVLYGNFASKNLDPCLSVILLFNRSVFHSLYIWTVLFSLFPFSIKLLIKKKKNIWTVVFVVPLEISFHDFLIIFSPSN